MVKTVPSNAGGVVSIPGQGTKVPHAMGYGKTNKQTNKQTIQWFLVYLESLKTITTTEF